MNVWMFPQLQVVARKVYMVTVHACLLQCFTGCDNCNATDGNDSLASHNVSAPDRNSDLGKTPDSLLLTSFVLNTFTDECTYMVESWDDEELDTDILLTEDDVPGASLKGKHPKDLTVVQLKRWLACRGAPLGGKKPELINR